jgi:flagellar hook-basal body complex protein FliE
MNKIQGLSGMQKGFENPLLTKVTGKSAGGPSFSDSLKEAIQDVESTQRVADTKLEMLASGKEVDIHGTMIAFKEADITMRLMGSFRDKITEAYKSLINMGI